MIVSFRHWLRIPVLCIAASSALVLQLHSQAQQPNMPVLDAAAYKGDPSLVLSLSLIRQIPSVLDDDPPMLRSFILLNNCHNASIANRLKNEFDYPSIVDFYKSHATQILAATPSEITIPLKIELGPYDSSRSAFPFHSRELPQQQSAAQDAPQKPQEVGISFDHIDLESLDPLSTRSCQVVFTFNGFAPNHGVAAVYDVAFAPLAITQIPMEREAARRYVESLPDAGSRPMTLAVQIALSPDKPRIVATPGRRPAVVFSGQIKSITAMSDFPGGKTFAVLDPAALAAPAAQSASQSQPAQPGASSMPGEAANASTDGQATAATPHNDQDGKMFQQYSSFCNSGDAKACAMVGYSYNHGHGVDKNPRMAKQFYDKACSMGLAQGCRESKFVKVE